MWLRSVLTAFALLLPRIAMAQSAPAAPDPGPHVYSDAGNIFIELNGKPFDTGLRKFGALLGDDAEVGCNSVLNPGSIIGRGSLVYPGTHWRGILPANMIVKNKSAQDIVVRRVRET